MLLLLVAVLAQRVAGRGLGAERLQKLLGLRRQMQPTLTAQCHYQQQQMPRGSRCRPTLWCVTQHAGCCCHAALCSAVPRAASSLCFACQVGPRSSSSQTRRAAALVLAAGALLLGPTRAAARPGAQQPLQVV